MFLSLFSPFQSRGKTPEQVVETGWLTDTPQQPIEGLHPVGPARRLSQSRGHGRPKAVEVVPLEHEGHDGPLEDVCDQHILEIMEAVFVLLILHILVIGFRRENEKILKGRRRSGHDCHAVNIAVTAVTQVWSLTYFY